MESGFNSGALSWLTPSLGTVDALAPIDAQPPNLREEMCGGHRRKPPSEENDEEEGANADGDSSSAQAFMLSSLKPSAGKFVLGPPVDTRAAGRGVHRAGRPSRQGAADRCRQGEAEARQEEGNRREREEEGDRRDCEEEDARHGCEEEDARGASAPAKAGKRGKAKVSAAAK